MLFYYCFRFVKKNSNITIPVLPATNDTTTDRTIITAIVADKTHSLKLKQLKLNLKLKTTFYE